MVCFERGSEQGQTGQVEVKEFTSKVPPNFLQLKVSPWDGTMSLEGLVKNSKSQYLAQIAFELRFAGMLMDILYKYKAGRGLVRLWCLFLG